MSRSRDASDASEHARRAWVRALGAHTRAAQMHAAAAELHLRTGHPDRREVELKRLVRERTEFDTEIARHPEWADDAPRWPNLGP